VLFGGRSMGYEIAERTSSQSDCTHNRKELTFSLSTGTVIANACSCISVAPNPTTIGDLFTFLCHSIVSEISFRREVSYDSLHLQMVTNNSHREIHPLSTNALILIITLNNQISITFRRFHKLVVHGSYCC